MSDMPDAQLSDQGLKIWRRQVRTDITQDQHSTERRPSKINNSMIALGH